MNEPYSLINEIFTDNGPPYTVNEAIDDCNKRISNKDGVEWSYSQTGDCPRDYTDPVAEAKTEKAFLEKNADDHNKLHGIKNRSDPDPDNGYNHAA